MKYDFITVGGATEDITFYTSEGVLIDNKGDILRDLEVGRVLYTGVESVYPSSYSTPGNGKAIQILTPLLPI